MHCCFTTRCTTERISSFRTVGCPGNCVSLWFHVLQRLTSFCWNLVTEDKPVYVPQELMSWLWWSQRRGIWGHCLLVIFLGNISVLLVSFYMLHLIYFFILFKQYRRQKFVFVSQVVLHKYDSIYLCLCCCYKEIS